MLVSSSTRLPLSLGPCQNNEITSSSSSSSSSSGSRVYRYPDANQCSEIACGAERLFREMPGVTAAAKKKTQSWMIYSILFNAVGVGVAALLSRTPAYRRLLIPITVIGAIFFLVVCLRKLFRAMKEENRLKEIENRAYSQLETFINDIFTRINAVNTIFPDGAIQNGQLTENFEINQGLENNLEEWVNTLRLVHGWEVLSDRVTRSRLFDMIEGNRPQVVQSVNVLTTHLPDIIQSIEDCRTAVAVITNPDSIWPGNTLDVQTRRVQGELSRLVSLIGLQNDARATIPNRG
jgi:hypothetical protein